MHCPDRKLSILTDRQILIMKKRPQAGMALGAFMLTGSVIQKRAAWHCDLYFSYEFYIESRRFVCYNKR